MIGTAPTCYKNPHTRKHSLPPVLGARQPQADAHEFMRDTGLDASAGLWAWLTERRWAVTDTPDLILNWEAI